MLLIIALVSSCIGLGRGGCASRWTASEVEAWLSTLDSDAAVAAVAAVRRDGLDAKALLAALDNHGDLDLNDADARSFRKLLGTHT